MKKATDDHNPECDAWRVCIRTEEEKNKIIESCHAGAGGINLAYSTCIEVNMNTIICMFLHVTGGHLERDKTIEKVVSCIFRETSVRTRDICAACYQCQRMNSKFLKSDAKLHPVPIRKYKTGEFKPMQMTLDFLHIFSYVGWD